MADVSSATKFFPTAKEGFTTTTSGSVSSGATSVGLNSVSGLTNGATMVFVIDPTDSTKKQAFTGVIDTAGSQVTGVVWTEGTNVAHSSGATVVDYETATHWALYSKGLLVQHTQAGAHTSLTNTSGMTNAGGLTNTGGITTDTLVVSSGTTLPAGDIVTADIADASITNAKLSTTTGELGGAWQSWTPTWTNFTAGNGTNASKYLQIGKTVFFRLKFTLGTTSATSASQANFTLPVTMATGAFTDNDIFGYGTALQTGTAAYYLNCRFSSTTTADLIVPNASGTYLAHAGLVNNVPFAWGSTHIINVTGAYEAA